jgi:hypothetical protein
MPFARLALLTSALLALAPAMASARPWNGISPGASTQADVVKKFGEPSKRIKRGAATVLAYADDEKLEGTKQAQFHVDSAGVVSEITIFLAEPLDAESVEGTFGKPPQKTIVEATFQKVWLYPAQGLTVYWAKDGTGAEALSFTAGRAARPGEAAPKAQSPTAEAGGKPGGKN